MAIQLSDFGYDQKFINFNTFSETLSRKDFILGASVKQFEQVFAQYNLAPDCVSTANCTDALRICLQAMGVQPKDTVAVPSFTWLSTAEVVLQLGANCLFIDVDETLTIDTNDLDRKLQAHPNTKACIFVDLFGNVANRKQIEAIAKRNNTLLIEDAAQATGAVSYNGYPICYSFYPTKNLGCWGDAGAVVCDSDFAEHIRSLRNHGQGSKKFIANSVGWNSRMDSIQADILLQKLPYLNEWNSRRRDIAEQYKKHINIPHELQKINTDYEPVYHQYVLITDHAQQIQQHLSKYDIQTRMYYSTPIHKLPLYNNGQTLSYTESLSGRNVCIPVHQYLTDQEVNLIIKTVNEVNV
jgi:dTDP-4-amino-4,6-dideoxygalactose transaminase